MAKLNDGAKGAETSGRIRETSRRRIQTAKMVELSEEAFLGLDGESPLLFAQRVDS